jgi:hypothetical protein
MPFASTPGESSVAVIGDSSCKPSILDHRALVSAGHGVQLGVLCTVIGLATRGIMMIESCKVMAPTEK